MESNWYQDQHDEKGEQGLYGNVKGRRPIGLHLVRMCHHDNLSLRCESALHQRVGSEDLHHVDAVVRCVGVAHQIVVALQFSRVYVLAEHRLRVVWPLVTEVELQLILVFSLVFVDLEGKADRRLVLIPAISWLLHIGEEVFLRFEFNVIEFTQLFHINYAEVFWTAASLVDQIRINLPDIRVRRRLFLFSFFILFWWSIDACWVVRRRDWIFRRGRSEGYLGEEYLELLCEL